MKEKLGTYLKNSRLKFNLKLRQVEFRTGISNAYISQLENNKISNPSPSVLYKLADCYKLSYTYLMRLAGYPITESPKDNIEKIAPAYRLNADFNNLTKEEEDKLIEYLSFLRSRRQK